LIIPTPQKKAINVPTTRNGPKGTSDFKVFLPDTINPNPIIAPIKKEKNRAIKILGKPRNKPIKKANLTSPKPSHLPREIKNITKKKADAKTAEKKGFNNGWKFPISLDTK
jgi:hypothetical protein